VTIRDQALTLAVALSNEEETTLGPTDSALCADALRYYAKSQLRNEAARRFAVPSAIVGLAIIGFGAMYSAAAGSNAKGDRLAAQRTPACNSGVLSPTTISAQVTCY
jgi:hypothetical protein